MKKKVRETLKDWEEILAERGRELKRVEEMLEELQEKMEFARLVRGISEVIRLKDWMKEPLTKGRPLWPVGWEFNQLIWCLRSQINDQNKSINK
jgi:hypothetical protein